VGGHRWADTDFTAKLIDSHPPNADFPWGVDLNVADSIVRRRYHNGPGRADLLKPGQPYEFMIEMYSTSLVFRRSQRIRLDVSSSNFPRFDVNPNTGATQRQSAMACRRERRLPRPSASVAHRVADHSGIEVDYGAEEVILVNESRERLQQSVAEGARGRRLSEAQPARFPPDRFATACGPVCLSASR
jgi:hypothetical protein